MTEDGPVAKVVLSGSFRKNPDLLAKEYNDLQEANCEVLSPINVEIKDESNGFVHMEGERNLSPEQIERRHLSAIQRADFVWFHAPEGYVGLSGSFELGFAHANGVPVYGKKEVEDETLRFFINFVDSPREAIEHVVAGPVRIPPALLTMQEYYKRATRERGHDDETARECLGFLREELKELEEALDSDTTFRQGRQLSEHTDEELADVFLYTIHMANLLDIGLVEAVRKKEKVNQKRFTSDSNE